MTLLTAEDLQEIRKRLEASRAMIKALCQPRYGEGAREWIMSIPTRPDYDPDLVIGATTSDVSTLLVAYAELRDLLVQCWVGSDASQETIVERLDKAKKIAQELREAERVDPAVLTEPMDAAKRREG